MSMRGEKIWIRIFIHFLPLRNKALFLVYYQKAIQSDAQLRKFMLKSKKVHVKLPCFRKFLSALHHFCHRWFFKGTNWKVKSLRTCPEKGARITDAGSMATLFFPRFQLPIQKDLQRWWGDFELNEILSENQADP